MAFIVVHAGVSLFEARAMTLREYQAIVEMLKDKAPTL